MYVIKSFFNSLIRSIKCSYVQYSQWLFSFDMYSPTSTSPSYSPYQPYQPYSRNSPSLIYFCPQLISHFEFYQILVFWGLTLNLDMIELLFLGTFSIELILGRRLGSITTVFCYDYPKRSQQVWRSALRGETKTISTLYFSTANFNFLLSSRDYQLSQLSINLGLVRMLD